MVTKKKKAEKARARAERANKERRRIQEEERKAYEAEHPEEAEEAAEEVVEEEIVEARPKEKHYIWMAIASVPVAICCDLGGQPFVALIMAAVALGVYRYNQMMYEDQTASRIPFWCGIICIGLCIGGWIAMALPAMMGAGATYN